MSQTDRWYLLKPQDFKEIQDYIDLLVCKLNGACQNKANFNVTEQEAYQAIQRVQSKTRSMQQDLLRRRNGN